MSFVTMVGFLAAGLVIATLSMRTMIPLRIVGLVSNVAFVTYGALFGSIPTVVLHAILFPLNVYRLHEMLKLVKQVEEASKGDMSLGWLKPFMTERAIAVGETLFRKGERANHLFFLVSGQLHLQEINLDLAPGAVVGELGMLAPERTRTQTLVVHREWPGARDFLREDRAALLPEPEVRILFPAPVDGAAVRQHQAAGKRAARARRGSAEFTESARRIKARARPANVHAPDLSGAARDRAVRIDEHVSAHVAHVHA